ncbi:MAG: hypothetical protein ACYTG6_03745 [Planctomycetota bacterium]
MRRILPLPSSASCAVAIRGLGVLFLSSVLVAAACTSTTKDGTGGVSTRSCEVHDVPMWTGRVPIRYGLRVPGPDGGWDWEAALARFPNTDDPVDGGCCVTEFTHVRLFICPRCLEARDAWLRAHPDVDRAEVERLGRWVDP